MSFFIRNKGKSGSAGLKKYSGSKAKKQLSSEPDERKRPKTHFKKDEEISSDSESDGGLDDIDNLKRKHLDTSSSEEDEETAQEKRLRLAKQYLSRLETEELAEGDDEETDVIAERLKLDYLKQSGKYHRIVASSYLPPGHQDIISCRGHQLSVTCVVISPDDKHVFSASKDCSVIKWCLATGKKVKVIPNNHKDASKGHSAHILCMAISTDNMYLASGDRNKLIQLWSPDTCDWIHTFTGHRDAVSGLAFRQNTHQLFSASHDRTVKVWNVDGKAYVETLFGHHDVIGGIDCLTRERAVTCGSKDGSIRIWKIVEESQLLFHGHSGSIDCVALINEENFISGGDDNSLALWTVMKKKPVVQVAAAHSGAENNSDNWITSVAAYSHSDLVASGSKDGYIRLWRCNAGHKSLKPVFSIPVVGFVNGLAFSNNGSILVAAIGKEHRLGRWWNLREAKNVVHIIKLNKKINDSAK